MVPQYTFALGSTTAIKKIFDLLNSQEAVYKSIMEKKERQTKYAIGSDETFAKEREILYNKKEGEVNAKI